jgi:hypothetical protein
MTVGWQHRWVNVWGHVVVPAPTVVVGTASPHPSLMASNLQFTHADLNMLALQTELLSVQAGPTISKHSAVAASWDAATCTSAISLFRTWPDRGGQLASCKGVASGGLSNV